MRNLFLFVLFFPLFVLAQKPDVANQAVVQVITFAASGDTLAKTQGCFISSTGEIVAPYAAFVGAVRAEVIDARDRHSQVLRIAGASDMYDLVRATTDAPLKKLSFLQAGPPLSDAPSTQWWQCFYTTLRKERPQPVSIVSSEHPGGYAYYTLSIPNDQKLAGCPIVDDRGLWVAIAQYNVTRDAKGLCAISSGVIDSLKITGTSVFNSDLNAILIPKLLPSRSEQEAYSYLYMILHSRTDSVLVRTAINDFMQNYPQNRDIYADAASYYATLHDYAAADRWLDQRKEMGGDDLDRIFAVEAQLKSAAALQDSMIQVTGWTLDGALVAIDRALALQDRPEYRLRRGTIYYAQKRDREAIADFARYNTTAGADAQSFLLQAAAMERSGVADAEVAAVLDSALTRCGRPYTVAALTPLIRHAVCAERMGDLRLAVKDLQDYEAVVGAKHLNAEFYLRRAELAQKARLFSVALDDFTTAVAQSRDNAEREQTLVAKALFCLQMGLPDEALTTARAALALNPRQADACKLIGVAYGEKKQRLKAREWLNKAVGLGDKNAADLLKKYR